MGFLHVAPRESCKASWPCCSFPVVLTVTVRYPQKARTLNPMPCKSSQGDTDSLGARLVLEQTSAATDCSDEASNKLLIDRNRDTFCTSTDQRMGSYCMDMGTGTYTSCLVHYLPCEYTIMYYYAILCTKFTYTIYIHTVYIHNLSVNKHHFFRKSPLLTIILHCCWQ